MFLFVVEMKLYIIAVIFIVCSFANASPTENRNIQEPMDRLVHGLKNLPNNMVNKVKDIIAGLHHHKDYPFQNPLWDELQKAKKKKQQANSGRK